MERAYITGGGDVVDRLGVQYFRLDIENYGKTAAFITGYDLHFATLAELKSDPQPRCVQRRYLHSDGISPLGGRRVVHTELRRPVDCDVVFGAVWYEDIFAAPYYSRFILRISSIANIPGEGLTRLDVGGVRSEYWERDKKAQDPA